MFFLHSIKNKYMYIKVGPTQKPQSLSSLGKLIFPEVKVRKVHKSWNKGPETLWFASCQNELITLESLFISYKMKTVTYIEYIHIYIYIRSMFVMYVVHKKAWPSSSFQFSRRSLRFICLFLCALPTKTWRKAFSHFSPPAYTVYILQRKNIYIYLYVWSNAGRLWGNLNDWPTFDTGWETFASEGKYFSGPFLLHLNNLIARADIESDRVGSEAFKLAPELGPLLGKQFSIQFNSLWVVSQRNTLHPHPHLHPSIRRVQASDTFYLIFSALSFISYSIKIYYHNKRAKARRYPWVWVSVHPIYVYKYFSFSSVAPTPHTYHMYVEPAAATLECFLRVFCFCFCFDGNSIFATRIEFWSVRCESNMKNIFSPGL